LNPQADRALGHNVIDGVLARGHHGAPSCTLVIGCRARASALRLVMRVVYFSGVLSPHHHRRVGPVRRMVMRACRATRRCQKYGATEVDRRARGSLRSCGELGPSSAALLFASRAVQRDHRRDGLMKPPSQLTAT
jgi:hypothetical protein